MAFLLSPLGRYAMIALGAIVLLGGVAAWIRQTGVDSVRRADAKAEAAAEANVSAHESTAAAITVQATQGLASAHQAGAARTLTLIKKVPVYVDAKADRACTVGTGFVGVFNAAASGQAELPGPAGGSEGSPSGIPLSAVLSTTVENFGVAYDWRAEALTWRSWYAAQREAWEKR